MPKAAIDEENGVNFFIQLDGLPAYIKAPTLIARATDGLLGGDAGQLLPMAEAERMRGMIPGSEIVSVANANHYTIITSDAFVSATVEFLNRAGSSRSE